MEHIKLICLSDRCLILNPDQKPTKAFITNLIEQLRCVYKDYVKINGVASMRMLYQRNTQARGEKYLNFKLLTWHIIIADF